MGYAHERGAAARNLLRARAHGNEDAIADAETLAHHWLGYDDDDVEEYIATRCEDFTPDPPIITDDVVERLAIYQNDAHLASWEFPWSRLPEEAKEVARLEARWALEATFTTKEDEA